MRRQVSVRGSKDGGESDPGQESNCEHVEEEKKSAADVNMQALGMTSQSIP